MITHDLPRFTAQFPGVPAVQWSGGRLDNNGESIRIVTATYRLGILDFRYEGDWYPATRSGASLEMINPAAARTAWELKSSWQPCVPSPGGPSAFGVVAPPDAVAMTDAPLVIEDAAVCPGPHASGSLTVAWSTVSGPGAAVFTAPADARTNVAFPLPGVYELRLQATAPGGAVASDSMTVNVSERYAGWAARRLATVPPADAAAGADVDGDGLTNLTEFALGGDPLTRDATQLLVPVPAAPPLALTWRRNLHADPTIQVLPEISSDLVNWQSGPDAVQSELVQTGGGTETWRSTDVAPGGSQRRWMRLRIVSP